MNSLRPEGCKVPIFTQLSRLVPLGQAQRRRSARRGVAILAGQSSLPLGRAQRRRSGARNANLSEGCWPCDSRSQAPPAGCHKPQGRALGVGRSQAEPGNERYEMSGLLALRYFCSA